MKKKTAKKNPLKKLRIVHNKELEKFIKLFKKYDELIDEEMTHGCYSAPEGIPYEFEHERDYYGKHERIVERACNAHLKIRKFINDYEDSFVQDLFIVVTTEVTNDPNECNSRVIGTFFNREDAVNKMNSLKTDSLKEFKDEKIEFENENQVIIRSKKDEDYRFEIRIEKSGIQN